MTKKLLLCLFLTASGALAAPGGLLAQGDDMYGQGRWLVGADGGVELWTHESVHNVPEDFESDVTNFGLRVGYSLSDNLAVDLAWNRIDEELDGGGELSTDLLSLGLTHHWFDGRFRPFFGGGVGLGALDFGGSEDVDLWNLYGQFGVSVLVGERVALDLGHTFRLRTSQDDAFDGDDWRAYGLVRAGVTVSF